jgi:cytochrome b
MQHTNHGIGVWDPVVRIGHCTLVIAVFIACYTGEEQPTRHVWVGDEVGGVSSFRLIWAFVGTLYPRGGP